MKYKVGDKVRVRKDLEVGKFYSNTDFSTGMKKCEDKIVEISKVEKLAGYYLIKEDDGDYYWSEEMFEPVITNLDKVKEGFKAEDLLSRCFCDVIRETRKEDCIDWNCKKCVEWLKQPYEEPKKEILDKEEKEYLSVVIKPFRDRIKFISKVQRFANKRLFYLETELKGDDFFSLPDFVEDTMYKGMELNREYTLEELGL